MESWIFNLDWISKEGDYCYKGESLFRNVQT